MKKSRLLLCLTLLVAIATYGNEPSHRVVHLFNGINLDGWYKYIRDRGKDNDPENVFTVKDGLLRVSGQEWGCITTDHEYENYKIIVEFKWGEQTFAPREKKARDSGLLLHSIGKDGGYNNVWMNSIECNIIEGGTGDFIVVGDGTDRLSITTTAKPAKDGNSHIFDPVGKDSVTINRGRIDWIERDPNWEDIKGFRGEKDAEFAVGEWNRLECFALGEDIYIFLNGVFVNKVSNVKPNKGRIQIQSEGAEILFRKIDLVLYDNDEIQRPIKTVDLEDIVVQRELLKEYFLCACIAEGFADKHIDESDISQAVYFDILRYSPKAFMEIKAYAKDFVKTIEPSPIEDLGYKKATLLNCIEKYKSREVNQLVKSMDKYLLSN